MDDTTLNSEVGRNSDKPTHLELQRVGRQSNGVVVTHTHKHTYTLCSKDDQIPVFHEI